MDPGQNPTEVPAWEASKENVLPIKRGRSAKGLSVSLAHPVSNEALNADQERAFERQINNNSVTDPLQKLEVYVRYLKWVRDTYPSVTDKALQILEVWICFDFLKRFLLLTFFVVYIRNALLSLRIMISSKMTFGLSHCGLNM